MTAALPPRPTRLIHGVFWLLLLVFTGAGQPCLWLGQLLASPTPEQPAVCCELCHDTAAPTRHAPVMPLPAKATLCCQTLQAVEPTGAVQRFAAALHPVPLPPAADWPGTRIAGIFADAAHVPTRWGASPPRGMNNSLLCTVLRRCVPAHAPPFRFA